ncbi:hypothetical protein C5167_037735 [Papaver somniferum]|uniref:Uncharacterized protein n=1 Tax=Papaver somniferum TaxID=3469 RepID=A0A4Y7I768_PAPSO|nr:uncharacterized protein LOC113289779 [Papaver somniferum]RZC44777.1 hypothetical protein C5167_037735 [Papaver somniferum]
MNSLVSLQGLPEVWWPRKRYDVNPAPKEIFIKPQRKDDGKIGVNPSLTMAQNLDKQPVSPTRAIGSNLDKSILMPVAVEASHTSKAADDSRKREEKSLKCKSHCSDGPEKLDHSPQELYCSDENSPLSHCPRRPIREGRSGVDGTHKIVADVEIFSDHHGDIGGTHGEVGATSPLRRAAKRHTAGSDMSDQGSEKKACSESGRPHGQDVGQPRERGRGSSLISPLGPSDKGKVYCPLPQYTAPQLCPPSFLMVAGFPVLPKYKDLYTRVVASKGHMASDTKVKSMNIQATMVTELLETIQQMSELSSRDVTSTNLQQWRASVDTASAMDFHVSWLDDQLHLLESKIRDVEELKATRRGLEAEVKR